MYINFLELRNILDFGVLIWISLFWKCITDSRMLCMNGIGTVIKKPLNQPICCTTELRNYHIGKLIEMLGFSLI